MKLEVFILVGPRIEKEGMVERLGEMRKGRRERIEQREDRDRENRESDKRELR